MRTSESELLSAFLDKELDSSELIRVKKLLATSPECREELERLKATKLLTAKIPPLTAPPDLLVDLLQQAESSALKNKKRFWEIPRVWVMASSFATAAVVLGLWIGIHQSARPVKYIELDTLMAVHNRHQVGLSSHQGIIAAKNYSAQLIKGTPHEAV